MDDHFYLKLDSHMVFVRDWDEKIIVQWGLIENTNATILICPNSTEYLTDHGVDDLIQLMCILQIETNERDAMVQHAAPA